MPKHPEDLSSIEPRPIVNGHEQDAYTGWRKYYCYLAKAGAVKFVKRQTHKRERAAAKRALRND